MGCLVDKSFKVKILHISSSDHINQPKFLIMDVTLTTGVHLLLSCIYRRPKGLFLTEFFDIYAKLAPNYSNIIIAGDLNCNLLDNSYTANHLKDFITESSPYCVPYKATFHKNNCDLWLDVILLESESKLVSYTKSDSPFIDGHDYLLSQYSVGNYKQIDKRITFRDLKNCDHLALSESLMNSLNVCDTVLEQSNPNELLNFFTVETLLILDAFAPVITRKIRRHRNPWFTKELKLKCKERDQLYKKARRNQDHNLLAL